MKISLEKLTDLAEITVVCLPEDSDPEDHFDDAECIQYVKDKLEQTQWAWCTVKVTALFAGISMSTYLGACSYSSEQEFINDEYFFDLKEEAILLLKNELEMTLSDLSELV